MDAGGAVARVVEHVGWPVDHTVAGVDWPAIQAHLRLRLPTDYVLLTSRLPVGVFNRNLRLVQPFPYRPPEMFAADLAGSMESIRLGIASGFSQIGRPALFPEPGGLIPWAFFHFAWTFAWDSAGPDPARWPCVVCSNDVDFIYRLDGSMTECLFDLITGRISVRGISLISADSDTEIRRDRPNRLPTLDIAELNAQRAVPVSRGDVP